MTDEQIEKASAANVLERQLARHNAKKAEDATMSDFDKTRKAWDAYDMMLSFIDGANFALSHQWISVKELLPNRHEEVLTYSIASEWAEDAIATAYYDGEDWYTLQGRPTRPNFWMLIPKLNLEKQSI